MITKGERREAAQRKAREHKEDGRSARLLQRIILDKAREISKLVRLRKG